MIFFWRWAQVLSHHFSRCFTKHFIEMTERSFHRGFPLPVVLPYCGPRCTTPSLGRSPRAIRWKNDDLGLVPIFKKEIFHKNLWFSIISFDWYTDSISKQLNNLKNINIFFSLFIFLCRFPFCFPVVLPYCIPRCTTPSLGRSPRANHWKNDDLGLVLIFKKKYFIKICDFPFFPSICIQTVF